MLKLLLVVPALISDWHILARAGAASLLTAILSESVLLDLQCSPKPQSRGKGAKMECFSCLPQSLPLRTHHSHVTSFARARPGEQLESKTVRSWRGKIPPQGPGRPCPSGWGDWHPPLPGTAGRQAAHLQTGHSQQHKG